MGNIFCFVFLYLTDQSWRGGESDFLKHQIIKKLIYKTNKTRLYCCVQRLNPITTKFINNLSKQEKMFDDK